VSCGEGVVDVFEQAEGGYGRPRVPTEPARRFLFLSSTGSLRRRVREEANRQ
jgi:hypothetical protein